MGTEGGWLRRLGECREEGPRYIGVKMGLSSGRLGENSGPSLRKDSVSWRHNSWEGPVDRSSQELWSVQGKNHSPRDSDI